MSIRIVIGKNFGDEGKGLAADYFALQAQREDHSCLVIRHNGGAQAGHTVDLPQKRFVFHQLSSGSFRGADTLWADTFLPDLYKLPEETEEFAALSERVPKIYADRACRCVCIDDVLLNMALEESRGTERHGSCGMGINEAVERSKYDICRLTLGEVCSLNAEGLYHAMARIRREYLPFRMNQLGLRMERIGEYGELLTNENVLYNAAETMSRAAESVILADGKPAKRYDDVIFEGAQGLLLDEEYEAYAPHLTSSRTGLHNPMHFMQKYLPEKRAEAVYVSRSYVTRHGAGPLPYEGQFDARTRGIFDATNVFNEWQGGLRFAVHGDADEFTAPVRADVSNAEFPWDVALMMTHLNETNRNVCTCRGEVPVKQWCRETDVAEVFANVYLSDSPLAQDVCRMERI